MGKMVGAAEFKANCLRIMVEADRSGEPVIITKRGKPFMELKPITNERSPFVGCMKGTVQILGDIVGPAYDGPWNAELDTDDDDPGAGRL